MTGSPGSPHRTRKCHPGMDEVTQKPLVALGLYSHCTDLDGERARTFSRAVSYPKGRTPPPGSNLGVFTSLPILIGCTIQPAAWLETRTLIIASVRIHQSPRGKDRRFRNCHRPGAQNYPDMQDVHRQRPVARSARIICPGFVSEPRLHLRRKRRHQDDHLQALARRRGGWRLS